MADILNKKDKTSKGNPLSSAVDSVKTKKKEPSQSKPKTKNGEPDWKSMTKGKASHNYRYKDPILQQWEKEQKKKGIKEPNGKEFYKKEYPKILKKMAEDYVAANPGSKLKKTESGYKITSATGKQYDLENPSSGGGRGWKYKRRAARNLEMLDSAMNNREYNEDRFRAVHGNYKVRTGSGGGSDFFSKAGQAFKDVAGSAMKSFSSGANILKNITKMGSKVSSGLVSSVGQAAGSKDIENLGKNLGRETSQGVDKYGDAAIDIAANAATSGAYGAIKQGLNVASTGDFSQIVNPENLANQALASATGFDPNNIKAATSFLKNPNKGLENAALSAVSGATGLDEQYLKAGSDVLGGKDIGKVGTNLALDKAGVSSPIKGLIKGETPDKLARGLAGEMVKDSNMAYTIKQGDSLSKIAAQNGVSVEELLAANPNIKDPNRILAGANLNIPGQEQSMDELEATADESGIASEIIEGSEATPNIPSNVASKKPSDGKVNAVKERTFFENVKRELGNFGDTILDNRNLVGTGVELAGAGLGYKAGQQGYDEYIKDIGRQEDYLSKQFKPTVTSPDLLKYKEDPNVKAAQEKGFDFYNKRLDMGFTPQEKEQIEKARQEQSQFAQGQRQAGLDLQARTAGGAATGGASLAASLLGAQGASNRLAADERNIQAEAFKNKEQAAGRMGDLARTRLQDEFSRAQTTSQEKSQFQKDLFNQKYMQGKSVADLKAQEAQAKLGKKGAEAQFYNTAATTINTSIGAAGQRKDEQAAIKNRASQRQHERELAQINSGNNKEQVNRLTKPVQTTTLPPRQSAVQPKPLPQQTAPQQAQQPYTVKGGDTLSALAKKYNTSVQDIQKKNKDITDPNKIKIGQKINF